MVSSGAACKVALHHTRTFGVRQLRRSDLRNPQPSHRKPIGPNWPSGAQCAQRSGSPVAVRRQRQGMRTKMAACGVDHGCSTMASITPRLPAAHPSGTRHRARGIFVSVPNARLYGVGAQYLHHHSGATECRWGRVACTLRSSGLLGSPQAIVTRYVQRLHPTAA